MEINQVGAFYRADHTEFVVWAPLVGQMDLKIDTAEQKSIPMHRDAFGYWKVRVPIGPGAAYRFQIDKGPSYPDPASLSQPRGVHGDSYVVDRNLFCWKDDSWPGMPVRDMIIYEIHPGTFSDQHNFAGIRGRLDYLKNVGINTIEIMPVAAFDGERNWGYDGVFPFAVQSDYGGADELKNLVNEAHDKGIAVLLDVVYNHLGPEGNILPAFGPYMSEKNSGTWGSSLNFDGPWSDGVRQYFIQNALMWLEDFHLDGLRLDAVHAIHDSGAKHFIAELQEFVDVLEKRTGKTKVLIAEIDLNDTRYLNPPSTGGYGLDAQWNDEFHHALHSLLTGEQNGYYEDFGSLSDLEKSFRDIFVFNGNFSAHRKRRFGSDASALAYDRFIVFAQNHDQTGNRLLGERLSALVSFEALKLSAAVMLLSPFVPLLFMGEEYGEKNPFLFFVDFNNEALLEKVRTGRKAEFSHFNHSSDFADPASVDTFSRAVLSWNYFDTHGDAMLRWYQWLITLRKDNLALKERSKKSVQVNIVEDALLLLERNGAHEKMFILFNFSKEKKHWKFPYDKPAKLLTDSSVVKWAGPSAEAETTLGPDAETVIQPESVLIYSTIL